jgi:hypothetical protein
VEYKYERGGQGVNQPVAFYQGFNKRLHPFRTSKSYKRIEGLVHK